MAACWFQGRNAVVKLYSLLDASDAGWSHRFMLTFRCLQPRGTSAFIFSHHRKLALVAVGPLSWNS